MIPGVADIVPALARRYRLAIVTSSEPGPFARTHARTGLLEHFELVLPQGDYARAKPEPDPYLRAVERLGLAPDRCLVIEDSERGLRAAKAAGLRCWVIPSALTAGGRFEAADAVLDDLAAPRRALLPARFRSPNAGVRSGRDAVRLEPGEHALPAVGRGFGPVARAVVGEEGVPGSGIDVDVGVLGGAPPVASSLLHVVDAGERDALVLAAVEAEHRRA